MRACSHRFTTAATCCYEAGWWRPVEDLAIEAQIMEVLERGRDEGVKVTRHLLGSVLKLGQLSVYVPREKWDANPDALVFANGTLEIGGCEFREHRPEDYATSALPYEYDPAAECEVFQAVLQKAVPDAVSFLQEFTGYCLTPNTSLETALWFKGPRGSGKSTVIEGLVAMLGDKHGDAEEVTPTAKIVWAMNEAPRIANTTSGIFRRVKIVEFPALKGERDPAVKEWV